MISYAMDVDSARPIGPNQFLIRPFGFGGGTIGSPEVATVHCISAVHAAWNLGVRFFDTAPWYGIGRSERRLGQALGDLNVQRDKFWINTKVGKTLVPEPIRNESNKTYCLDGSVRTPRDTRTGFRVNYEYGADAIRRQHESSLQRLGHARVDSLTIHDIDYGYHDPEQLEEYLHQLDRDGGGGAEALEDMRASGAIRSIGCGCNLESRNAFSWENESHERLCERIADLVDLDFFVVAGGYTLLETRAMRRVFPLCQERGIRVIAATPFAGGWLVSSNQSPSYMYGPPSEGIERKTNALRRICHAYNVPLPAAAMQFQLAHSLVSAIIPGAKSAGEVEENYQLLQHAIPSALWTELRSQGLVDPEAPIPG
ncbi:MAG: aldo/keto reductase [Gammaproteobacteria bacterium]|nr:aldo/keto reductase [Gammaproteobacteria bacterium]